MIPVKYSLNRDINWRSYCPAQLLALLLLEKYWNLHLSDYALIALLCVWLLKIYNLQRF